MKFIAPTLKSEKNIMQEFAVGQRWISDTESDLGLGTIIDVSHRQVTIAFLASGESRIYAKETAPLTRIAFSSGDTITNHDEQPLAISEVREVDGCVEYHGVLEDGSAAVWQEADLNNRLSFNTPRDRLFAGQLDSRRWFALRNRVLQNRFERQRSVIRGLEGARVSIIPHQIYIAASVSDRLYPRVLLADEVGLGKTIEAGLILHRQLATHQIERVLIVVPETLLHQWLVEMLRKFNLHFHIIDADRYEALQESAPDGNPFMAQQLVLCTLQTLLEDDAIAQSALAARWDSLTVDEAHHLHWSEDLVSEEYQLIEALAQKIPSVLLLTATPEQLGQSSHFARLRLLDPDRFSTLTRFREEEQGMAEVATLAEKIFGDDDLEAAELAALETLIDRSLPDNEREVLANGTARSYSELREQTLDALIDRHGTSRVLYRNTRQAISGFPGRALLQHALEPDQVGTPGIAAWLKGFLQSIASEKALVICSQQSTVMDLCEALRSLGVVSTQFHEGMSIVDRDRAAAWFADEEDECRLLVCSEIGSEGRNFQFVRHLVMLELPIAPDLLEQRIGRLDRIGQQHEVQVHVPSLPGSRDQRLMRWYHEGLNAFEQICRVGNAVREQLGAQLDEALVSATDAPLDACIEASQKLSTEFNDALEQGRDRLLELNSNRTEKVQEHLDQLYRGERDFSLADFMGSVFDSFGVDHEPQSNNSWILKPSDHMQVQHFPGLEPEGLTVTFSRATALEREDFVYLSWDHPMVVAALDLVLEEGFGQANGEVISSQQFPAGVILVECLYSFECITDRELLIERFFEQASHRTLLGSNRKDYTASLPELELEASTRKAAKRQIAEAIRGNQRVISALMEHSQTLANRELESVTAGATAAVEAHYLPEIERLEALRKVNPAVREEEIAGLQQRQVASREALQHAQAKLASVRILFNVKSS